MTNPSQHHYVNLTDSQMEFSIDLKAVLQKQDTPAYNKKAVMSLMEFGVLPCGMFFAGLQKEDIIELTKQIEPICIKGITFVLQSEENKKDLMDLTLLASLLAIGEGEPRVTPDSIMETLPNLFVLVQLEIMHRNNIIEIDRSQMSIYNRPEGADKPLYRVKAKKFDLDN